MHPTLSIVLPIHNVQRTLRPAVLGTLEVASDLPGGFQVALIDDGSADATCEIAYELSRLFPQVRVSRHATRRGLSAAWRTGLAGTDGQIVLLADEQWIPQPQELPRLWNLIQHNDALMLRPGKVNGSRVLADSSLALVVHRADVGNLFGSPQDWFGDDWSDSWRQVNVRPHLMVQQALPQLDKPTTTSPGTVHRQDRRDRPRPSYLIKLKEFALGE